MLTLLYCLSGLNPTNALSIFLQEQILHIFTVKSKYSFLRPWSFWTRFLLLQIDNMLCELQLSKLLWGGNRFLPNQKSPLSEIHLLTVLQFKFHHLLRASCFLRTVGRELPSFTFWAFLEGSCLCLFLFFPLNCLVGSQTSFWRH